MKIKHLLSRIDLSKQQHYQVNDYFISEFDDLFNENDINVSESKFKEIWLHVWLSNRASYDDDKLFWQGLRIVLLNDIPICISYQLGKSQDFEWFSEDSFDLAKEHIFDISNYSVDVEKIDKFQKSQNVFFLKEDSTISDYYSIGSSYELLRKFHQFGFYKNGKVSISPYGKDCFSLKIIFESNETKIVDIRDIKFPIMGLKE